MNKKLFFTILITILLSLTYSTLVSAKDYRLIKTANNPAVFLVKENRRVHIPNEQVFEAGGYTWNEIEIVSEKEMNGVPNTALIKSPVDAKVFLISDGKKQWIPDEKTFLSTGFSWSDIVLISQPQVKFYIEETFHSADAVTVVEEQKKTSQLEINKPVQPIVAVPDNTSQAQDAFVRPQHVQIRDLGRKQIDYIDSLHNTQYEGEGIASLLLSNNGDVVVRDVTFKNKKHIEHQDEDGSIWYEPDIEYVIHTTVQKDGVVIRDLGEQKVVAYNEKNQFVTYSETNKKATFHDGEQSVSIPDIAGPVGIDVFDLSNTGVIVGKSSVVQAPHTDGITYHAFVYENGVTKDITPFTLYDSTANAVNEDGTVVGYYSDEYGTTKAFMWKNGNRTTLSDTKMTKGQTVDVTEDGIVLGRASSSEGICVIEGCSEWGYWENGLFYHLPKEVEEVFAMNSHKEVVGYVYDSYIKDNIVAKYPKEQEQFLMDNVLGGAFLRGHAVVYTNGQVIMLDDIVKDDNILITNVVDINERGEILAYGFDLADVYIHAYLIQLPASQSALQSSQSYGTNVLNK